MTRFIGSAEAAALIRGARPFASGINSSALHVLGDWAADAPRRETRLLPLDECDPASGYAVVTLVGSPTALAENLPCGDEPERAIGALERATGRDVRGVIPINTAGENAVLALATAASLGVDLVDADGCGRVRPTVEDTLLTRAGVPIGPCTVVSPFGELVVIDAPAARVAQIVPRLVSASGGWVYFAGYPLSGGQLTAHAHPGTISRFLDARPGNELAGVPHRIIARAVITEVIPPCPGNDRMSVLMREQARGERPARRFRVDADGAYLSVLADGAPILSTPHELIVVSEGGEVLDPDRCLPGMRVDLVAVDLPAPWTEETDRLGEGAGDAP